MNRATKVNKFHLGDKVLVNINGKLSEGTLQHTLGEGLFLFEHLNKSTSVIALDQISEKIYTEEELVIKIPKGTECIIDKYYVNGETYLISLHRITDKND